MNATEQILAVADRCVMCGLCLPHCPTYILSRSEAESPRGRIALMQALASGRLGKSAVLQRHLDSCLVCRACEKMCPSKVRYGELIDTTRALLRSEGRPHKPPLQKLLSQVEDVKKLQRSAGLLRNYQQSGVQRLMRRSGLLKVAGLDEFEATLPPIPPQQRLAERYPARGERRGRIGLFTGCIGSLLEGEVHRAAITLLTRLGYEVHVPASQGCCGSLHQHNGELTTARAMAKRNIAAFKGLDAVISTASGCAAQLVESPALDEKSGIPFHEACDFLANLEWPQELALKPLPQKVLLHLSCTQRNVLQTPGAVTALLSRIPQLVYEELPENDLCCGAAGSYLLTQPEKAAALRRRKLNHLTKGETRLLVSNNIGCATHLEQGLQQRGVAVKLVHPLLLLQRALP